MKRLSNIRNILLLCATVLLSSCDLTETMQVEADKSMVFGSESGIAPLCLLLLSGVADTYHGLSTGRNV